MVHILLPFMVLPLYSAMQKIPQNLSQAGASLGGSPLHVFVRVFLPLSMSGVVRGRDARVRAVPRLLHHA